MALLNLAQPPVSANNFGVTPGTAQPDTLSVTFANPTTAGNGILVIACIQVLGNAGGDAAFADVTITDSQGNGYGRALAIGDGGASGAGARAHYPGSPLFMLFDAFASSGPLTINFSSVTTFALPFLPITYRKGIAAFELTNFSVASLVNFGSLQLTPGTAVTINDSLGNAITTNAGGSGFAFDGYQEGLYVVDVAASGVDFFLATYLGPAVVGGGFATLPPSITSPYVYSNTDFIVVGDGTGGTVQMAVFVPGLPITLPSTPPTLACPANSATLGVPYSSNFVATGGTPPYTFAITAGSLPPGLLLSSSTGAVTGTPTMTGVFHYTGQVTDSGAQTATTSCTITVLGGPPPPPSNPCQVVIPSPSTDVQFELKRIYASMVPHKRIPVRGS